MPVFGRFARVNIRVKTKEQPKRLLICRSIDTVNGHFLQPGLLNCGLVSFNGAGSALVFLDLARAAGVANSAGAGSIGHQAVGYVHVGG